MSGRVKCIFSMSTGRSGSHYLSDLLGNVADCQSFHQREPFGNGHAMRRFLQGDSGPMEAVASAKVIDIEVANAGGRVYAETNHCFVKGFGWLLPERIEQRDIGVVILERSTEEIAASTLKIGSSPLSKLGRDWTITPEARDPLTPPPRRMLPPRATFYAFRGLSAPFRRMGRVYRAAGKSRPAPPGWIRDYEMEVLEWYVAETRARTAAFQSAFSEVRYHTTSVTELNTRAGVDSLLEVFGLTALPSISGVIGRSTNRDGIA